MRSQEHNQGDLKELKVNIEADVVDSFVLMSDNTGIALEELVVIALKRFKTHHSDYLKSESQNND